MLSEKYIERFLKIGSNHDYESVLRNIVEIEKSQKKEFLKWNEKELQIFLRSFKSISPVSLNHRMFVLRNFCDYICDNERIPKVILNLKESNLYDCIDHEKLLSLTIDYNEYNHIRNQLTTFDGNNVRDKLMFELAWEGLSNEEIKNLKENDIEFIKNDYDFECAILKINKDKNIKVEDPFIVQDIKIVIKETEYFVTTKNDVTKKFKYKDSEFLFKPVKIGKQKFDIKSDASMANPSMILQNVIRTNNITCEGIDMDNLSIEDIKRSKMIYLSAPENKEYFDRNFICVLFGLKNDSSLFWIKKVAELKYKKDI
jgi:site-specific recombinase XerD